MIDYITSSYSAQLMTSTMTNTLFENYNLSLQLYADMQISVIEVVVYELRVIKIGAIHMEIPS